MFKIAICDDEMLMCNLLKQKVSCKMKELETPCKIFCFTNVNTLWESLSDIDILLLDIQMPEQTGIEFAKKVRQLGYPCALIFITVLKEYVFDAFEVEAVDYICKPVNDIRLKNALTRATKQVKDKKEKSLFIQTLHWCKYVKLSHIYYCEVINRKIYLHTQNGIIEYYSRMEDVEKQLDYRFIKCHRSYLVNLDYLSKYANGQITLENGAQIPVSKLRQREFMETMLQYMKKKEE